MKPRTVQLFPILALLLALPTTAQEEVPPRPSKQPETFSFQFPGGSLADYCKVLRGLAGGRANIVAPARATEVMLPAMELTKVTTETAVQALATVAEPAWRISYRPAGDAASTPVYGLQLMEATSASTVQGSVQAVGSEVISLANLVRTPGDLSGVDGVAMKAESILTALQHGLSLSDPDNEKARIVYHEETALLFVRSTHDDLRLANNTVQALQQDLDLHRNNLRQQRATEHRAASERQQSRKPADEVQEEPILREAEATRRRR